MVTDEDEYYEVDDLEEMHTAIVNDDYDQVSQQLSLLPLPSYRRHLTIGL